MRPARGSSSVILYELSYVPVRATQRWRSRHACPTELADRFHDLFGGVLARARPRRSSDAFDVPPNAPALASIIADPRLSATAPGDSRAASADAARRGDGPPADRATGTAAVRAGRAPFVIDGPRRTPAWSQDGDDRLLRPARSCTSASLWLAGGSASRVELDGVARRSRSAGPGRVPANSVTRGRRRRRGKADPSIGCAAACSARLRRRARLGRPSRALGLRSRAAFGPIGSIPRRLGAHGPGPRRGRQRRSGCSSTCARSRPDINAWFVRRARDRDWKRLRRARGDRLVAYGHSRWLLADAPRLLARLVARGPTRSRPRRVWRASSTARRGGSPSSSTA